MRNLNHLNSFRVEYQGHLGDKGNGAFQLQIGAADIRVIASDGLGWDHVSVSTESRCPTWSEMCIVKDLFFEESEWVGQFHPAKKDYVNHHPYCLHLWRPQFAEFPKPIPWMVGPSENHGSELTEDQINVIREGLKKAQADIEEWERLSRPTREQLQEPIHNPGTGGRR